MKYLFPRAGLKLAALLALAVFSVLVLGFSQPTHAATSSVVVSLEFDDGTADQLQADSILTSHGYHGVFYINSGRLGAGGYMTLPQAQTLATNGHEIGGHTVNHADLPTLDLAEQQRQVCNDRVTLLTDGFSIYDFAYPYGDYNSTAEGVTSGCGYNSARVIGGVVSPGTCHGCPYADTVPPTDLYATLTPDSIKSGDTPASIENYVTQASTRGGGWVQLVMHHLCSGSGCDTLSVDPATLSSFLDWLQTQSYVTVKTVHEVIGGGLQSGVNGPPPTATGQLQNNSFENPATGSVPTCWKYTALSGASGTETRTSDAYTGSQAVRLTASSIPSGGAIRVYSTQDLGTCSPSASGGDVYQINAWVKGSWTTTSSSGLRLVTYYRNANNNWAFGTQSPYITSSSAWKQVTWTPPALPNGTTAISVLVSLQAVGNVTVDDVSLLNTASDVTPPTVAVTSPSDGATVTGTVNITATASDNVGIGKVEFYAGGNLIATDTSAPYSATWDSSTEDQSNLGLAAKAYDLVGNSAVSAVNVTVQQPDRVPPTATLTGPSDGATVSGVVSLTADATDDQAISKVEFYAGSTLIGTSTTAPYQANWDSTTVPSGSYAITAKPYDTSNNTATSNVATVTVSNVVVPPPPTNLLKNPSLETSASGFPTCWLKGGFGTNAVTWTYTTDAHTGSFAENLQITSYTSGDRKMVNTQDAGNCAPAVTPGQTYTVSAWYKSTVSTHFFVFYRNSAGNWVYWKESPNVAASSTWAQATWTTPAIPVGATLLSVGLGITAVGSLTQDDLSLIATGS